jgi:hypothetical protein
VSPDTREKTTLLFTNRSPAAVTVAWIGHDGQPRTVYPRLLPGEAGRQNTYVGHVFVVTRGSGERAQVVAGAAASQVVIE